MTNIYLGIGTNLGDKEANIRTCLQLLEERVGHITQCSALFYSKPEGFVSVNDFVNVVVRMQTSFSPLALLEITQAIEQTMGRTQKSEKRLTNGEWQVVHFDRVIDIDILYYGDVEQVYTNEADEDILILPHPRIAERDFVRIPLAEVWNEKSNYTAK